MKKIFLALSLLVIVAVFMPVYSFAQEIDTIDTTDPIDAIDIMDHNYQPYTGDDDMESENIESDIGPSCFDYYEFQSVQVSFGSELLENQAGDEINFVGKIKNNNLSPVFDGNVFVRISEKNVNFIADGHNIIDEIVPIRNINLDIDQEKDFDFVWTAPENLKAGAYQADFFFFVGDRFNLSGLTFTNEIYIGYSDFNIISNNMSKISFDRSATKVDDVRYNHIGAWPKVEKGDEVVISQMIENSYTDTKKIEITYDLYSWDSLNTENLISSKVETIEIESSSNQILTYTLPSVEHSVYYLQITARSGDDKNIVNVRLVSDINSARLNYVGLNKFPVAKGETATLYNCYHNTTPGNTSGSFVTTVYDSKNNILGEIKYDGDIPSDISVQTSDILASARINEARIVTKLYDENNNLIDEYEVEYSCESFDSENCLDSDPESYPWFNIIITISIFLIIILVLVLRKRFNRSNKSQTMVGLLVLLLVTGIFVALHLENPVAEAQKTVSTDLKTVTETKSISYDIGFNTRRVASGSAGVTFSGRMEGDFDLNIGESVTFDAGYTCAFNFTGGAWDTPWCGTVQEFLHIGDGSAGRRAKLIFWNSDVSFSVVSSDPDVMTCEGLTCTAVGAGNTGLTLKSNNVNMWPIACAERVDGWQTCTETSIDKVTFIYTGSHTSKTTSNQHIYFKSGSDYWSNVRYKTIPKFSHIYDLTVTQPSPVNGNGGDNGGGDNGGGDNGGADNGEEEGLTLRCIVEDSTGERKTSFNTGETVKLVPVIGSPQGGVGAGLGYTWTGNFLTEGNNPPGDLKTTNPPNSSVTNSFQNPGTYYAVVSAEFGGVEIGPTNCISDVDAGGILIIDALEISFDIHPRIADEDGLCESEWSVDAGGPVTCNIITEFNETAVSLGSVDGPTGTSTQDVSAGNEYRLQCVTDEGEVVTSESRICIDPNLIEI